MRLVLILLGMMVMLSGCTAKEVTTSTQIVTEAALPATEAATEAETTAAETEASETTAAAEETKAASALLPTSGPFVAADLLCNDMPYGCLYDNSHDWFGFSADSVRAGTDLEGNPIHEVSYGSCLLIFSSENFILTEAQLDDAALAGPRGIAVGDTLSDIEEAFGLSGDGLPYYEAEGELPPRAEKLSFEGDSTYLILLTAPMEAYTEETLSQERAYMDLPHAQLVYTLDTETHIITSIHWLVAPLGENR